MQKSKDLQKIHSAYASMLNNLKKHNIEGAHKAITVIQSLEANFWQNINAYLTEAEEELKNLKESYSDNSAYLELLKKALEERGLTPDETENSLILGPMEVVANLEEYHLQLVMGRKKTRISDLELSNVTKLLEQRFKKLNSSFNANAYFKRLLKAYEYASSRMYGSKETRYGFAVSLRIIFEIFSIAPGASDYKMENFLWDLGRLITHSDSYGKYRIEYGYSRNVGKMHFIKTSNGDSLKVSTLSIFQEE